jgi:hypothetical protein
VVRSTLDKGDLRALLQYIKRVYATVPEAVDAAAHIQSMGRRPAEISYVGLVTLWSATADVFTALSVGDRNTGVAVVRVGTGSFFTHYARRVL